MSGPGDKLGPPSAGSPYECTLAFHEECDLLTCAVRATILGLEHGIGTLKDLAAREKIRADAATKALLDYAERNATPKEAPSASLSEALTGKEGLEACGASITVRSIPHLELRCRLVDGHAEPHRNGSSEWTSEQPRAAPPSASLPAGPKDLERAAAQALEDAWEATAVAGAVRGFGVSLAELIEDIRESRDAACRERDEARQALATIAAITAAQAPSASAVPATETKP